MNKAITTYCLTSYAYTAIRKTLQLWDAKIERKIEDTYKPTNMLLGEKLFVFGASVVMAPGLVPFYLLHDLNRVDIYFSGLRSSEYGYPPHYPLMMDYIFK